MLCRVMSQILELLQVDVGNEGDRAPHSHAIFLLEELIIGR
jgi:hypothetical protein